jgi:2-keto-4-pentenoate hydratase/2-oxohepta-3-ene-1,7-dioic acid hydratase in catechol pathway
MKLALFDEGRVGVVQGDAVVDISGLLPGSSRSAAHDPMIELIENFEQLRGKIDQRLPACPRLPLSRVALQSPISRPSKIIAMGSNYLEGTSGPPLPIWAFFKSPQSILGPEGTVVLPPVQARIFHHEAELVAVIGSKSKNLDRAGARARVFGYTAGIDVSGRFELFAQSIFNKSHDTFAPLGPWIVTADEVPDPQSLQIRLWVDGQPRHDFNTSDMGHDIADSLQYVSSVTTLNPGDLLFTGTNHQGIGPIQDGERVELEIEHIGRLCVNVSDALKRSWPKEIEKEMGVRIIKMIKEGISPGGGRIPQRSS